MKASNLISIPSAFIGLAMCVLLGSVSSAQETKSFATKGVVELGGNISYESITQVMAGNTVGSALKIFTLQPHVGYFVTDCFELGVNPFGIETMNSGGTTITQVMIFAAPSYNFKTEGNTYPFIEALLGYTSDSDGSTMSGFSWGLRGGAKVAVVDHVLLDLAIQYLQVTTNPSGATSRTGTNQFSISAGFGVWL